MSAEHGDPFNVPAVVDAAFEFVWLQFPEMRGSAAALRANLQEALNKTAADLRLIEDAVPAVPQIEKDRLAEAESRIARFADGKETSDDRAWARFGFHIYWRNKGELPLEKCFRLGSPAKRKRDRRGDQIRAAAKCLKAPSRRALCALLKSEWDKFLRTKIYDVWASDEVPDDASSLYIELFHATFYNKGKSASRTTIGRALSHY